MSYGRFRTGANQEDKEGRDIAKINALESIDRSLVEVLIVLKQIAEGVYRGHSK